MKGRNRRGATPPHAKKAPASPPLPRAVSDAVAQRLHRAVAHHQRGDFVAAEEAYRAVLATLPRHADALNLLGVLCLQTGRAAESVALLSTAVDVHDGVPDYHDNLGSALAAAGMTGDAVVAHRRAIRLQPDYATARYNLGNAYAALGRHELAADALRRAVALRPDYARAWHNLGNACAALRQHRPAAAAFARAVALAPDMVAARTNLGDSLSALGALDEALLQQQAVVALRPDDANEHYNLGVVLQQAGRKEQAELAYRDALRRQPGHVGAWNNLGSVLRRLHRPEQAAHCHRMAMVFRPDFLEAYYNLGNICQHLNRHDEAVAIYERVLASNPALAVATHNLGKLSLIRGDLARGWEGHEKRFSAGTVRPNRRLPLPRWNGEPLAGRRLLVWREQGVGDEIMFASCYPELAAAGGPVTVETDRRLTSLLARSFPALTFRHESCDSDGNETRADLVTDFDLHCPAGSLPRLQRQKLSDFAAATPRWLTVDPVRLARWRTRLGALGRGLKVGICWRSQLRSEERDAAYTTLDDWSPLFRTPGIRLVNLQYDDCAAEIADAEARFGCQLHRWDELDLRDDFEAAAALIANLDLVITVATSVGELASAVGTPVWRIGGTGDWSTLGAACRPWHPAMRLWTAAAGESLPQVLARTARALAAMAPTLAVAAPRQPSADELLNQALRLHRSGQGDQAIHVYHRMLALDPIHADGLHLLGLCQHQRGNSTDGEILLRRALRVDADFAFAANNLGLVLQARRQNRQAERAFAVALALNPAFGEAASHLGLCLQNAKKYPAASRWHRRAVRLAPQHAPFHINLGATLERAGDFAAADLAYRRALIFNPGGLPDVLNNLGSAARRTGRADKAALWMRRSLALAPDFALAAWNVGLLELANGNLTTGWDGYERRFFAPQLQRPRDVRLPVWRGEPLQGRRLLIWDEQGIGDEILFATCLPDLAMLDGTVVVECDRRLVSLFARAFPWAEVRETAGAPGGPERRQPSDCHLQLPIGSLPARTRRTLTAFPMARPAVLAPRPELAAQWRSRVDALPAGLKIGVAWTSQVVDADREGAYTRLVDWLPVLEIPGVVAVNLQYGDQRAEIAALARDHGQHLHVWDDLDLKDDFESLAALTVNLDLVISPASSVGEFAGALGATVWRVCANDWSQLGAGARPWFPTMQLFNPQPGDSVAITLPRVARFLRQLLQTADHP